MKYALAIVLSLAAFPAFAAVNMSIAGLVSLVVALIVIGVIFGLLYVLVDRAPFIPDPWKAVIKYVILAFAILALIGFLLDFVGFPVVNFR